MLDSTLAGQVIAEIKLKHLGPIKQMPSWEQIAKTSQSINYQKCQR